MVLIIGTSKNNFKSCSGKWRAVFGGGEKKKKKGGVRPRKSAGPWL